MLKKFCDLCYPMSCRIHPHLSQSSGLQPSRGYSLISAREVRVKGRALRMVFLRNPFGIGEWQGRWSDGSDAWDKCPAARGVLRYMPYSDGAFWMSFAEFVRHF